MIDTKADLGLDNWVLRSHTERYQYVMGLSVDGSAVIHRPACGLRGNAAFGWVNVPADWVITSFHREKERSRGISRDRAVLGFCGGCTVERPIGSPDHDHEQRAGKHGEECPTCHTTMPLTGICDWCN